MFWKLPIKKISYDTKKVTFKSIKDINIIEEMRKEITSLKKTIEEMKREKSLNEMIIQKEKERIDNLEKLLLEEKKEGEEVIKKN